MSDVINRIERRIVSEYEKHPGLDWVRLSAIKIYKEFVEGEVGS